MPDLCSSSICLHCRDNFKQLRTSSHINNPVVSLADYVCPECGHVGRAIVNYFAEHQFAAVHFLVRILELEGESDFSTRP